MASDLNEAPSMEFFDTMEFFRTIHHNNVRNLPIGISFIQIGTNYCFAFVGADCAYFAYVVENGVEDLPAPFSAQEIGDYIDSVYPIPLHLQTSEGRRYGHGAYMMDTFEYLEKFGVCENTVVPFRGFVVRSVVPPRSTMRYYIRHFQEIDPGSDLIEILESSLIAVELYCGTEFTEYTGGVYDGLKGDELIAYKELKHPVMHFIVVVGWGLEDDKCVFLAKNSWGEDWGVKGYCKLSEKFLRECKMYCCMGGYSKRRNNPRWRKIRNAGKRRNAGGMGGGMGGLFATSSNSDIGTDAMSQVQYDKISRSIFTSPGVGLNAYNWKVLVNVKQQSPDIAQGVHGHLYKKSAEIRAGDPGLMLGYCTDENAEPRPLNHDLPTQVSHASDMGELLFFVDTYTKGTIPGLELSLCVKLLHTRMGSIANCISSKEWASLRPKTHSGNISLKKSTFVDTISADLKTSLDQSPRQQIVRMNLPNMVTCGTKSINLRTKSNGKVNDWIAAINDAALRPPEGWCHPHRFGSFAPPRGLPEDSSQAQWFVDGRAAFEAIRVLRYPDHFPSGVYLWSHHEKLVIVDHQICFIGGLDLCFGRYDSGYHRVGDHPSQIWPGKDYYSPRTLFGELSSHVSHGSSEASDKEWWEIQESGGQVVSADEIGQVGPRVSCRSQNQFFISGLSSEDLVQNRVLDAIYKRIMRAHHENKCFRVIIVIPLLPGFQGVEDDSGAASVRAIMHWQYRTISRGNNSILNNLNNLVGPRMFEFISFYGLRGYGKLYDDGPVATIQINVHSKIMIDDDHTTLIGSANINDRSLLGSRDSEFGALIEDNKFVNSWIAGKPCRAGKFALSRCLSLWSVHIGLHAGEVDRIIDTVADSTYNDISMATAKIFVHSKIMIVDGHTMLIASANINDRSLLGFMYSEDLESKVACETNMVMVFEEITTKAQVDRSTCRSIGFTSPGVDLLDTDNWKVLVKAEQQSPEEIGAGDPKIETETNTFLFTSESVNEIHPDKLCDHRCCLTLNEEALVQAKYHSFAC